MVRPVADLPQVSVSTTRVSTKERAAVVEWKLKEIIGKIQLMKFTLLR
jgi:hypothetical protein